MKQLTFFTLSFLLFVSCRKDSESFMHEDDTFEPDVEVIEDYEPSKIEVTASVFGKVFDEMGNGVPDASVVLGANTETTNDEGVFLFVNTEMNAAGTYIEVEQEGFARGSARFFPKENSQNYINIRLLSKEMNNSFFAADGGIIEVEGGIQIDIPAKSVLDSDGNEFDGDVLVFARRVGPEAEYLTELMPGNLQGIDWKNEDVALTTYGMVAIELAGSDGAPLHLDKNRKATLSFPVFGEQINNAPAEVSLWYFNRTYGLWHEQGKALLENGKYVGEVYRLSFCNFGNSFPSVKLSGTLVSNDGAPIAKMLIRANDFLTAESGYTITDNKGHFSTCVPADKDLKMLGTFNTWNCNYIVSTSGSYPENKDLGEIIIEDPNLSEMVTLTGSFFDCDGQPINESLINISSGSGPICYYQTNGNEIEWAIPNCSVDTLMFVQILDLANFQQSNLLEFGTVGDAAIGALEVCDVVAEKIWISFNQLPNITFEDNPSIEVFGDSIFIQGSIDTMYDIQLDIGIVDAGDFNTEDILYFGGTFPFQTEIVSIGCGIDCGLVGNIGIFGSGQGELISGTFQGSGIFMTSSGDDLPLSYEGGFTLFRDN